MAADIVIRNAKLRDGTATDIAIADGKYAALAPGLSETGALEIDADGHLTTESFVIAQLHLDKVLTGDWLEAKAKEVFDPAMGGTMTAIELATIVKQRYDEADILGPSIVHSPRPRLTASPTSAPSSTSIPRPGSRA